MAELDSSPPKIWYEGNCHCGAVKYKVHSPRLEDSPIVQCNCSICSRNGYLSIYPQRDEVVFHQGYDSLTNYRCASKRGEHRFCPVCGSSVMIDFCKSMLETYGDAVAMNIRMFKDVDLGKLQFKNFDGKTAIPVEYKV